jgi:hypothetical protein
MIRLQSERFSLTRLSLIKARLGGTNDEIEILGIAGGAGLDA